MACRNGELAERRKKKRQALLDATVEELKQVERMVSRGRLRGREAIQRAVAGAVGSKLRPYVSLDVRDDGFEVSVDEERLVAAWTRTTRADLERLEGLIEGGKLKGSHAIGERVQAVLARRKVGQHIQAKVAADGFEISIDSEAICTQATAPLRRKLDNVRRRIERGTLYGEAAIGVRVGKVVNKYNVAKHFLLDIRDDSFDFLIDEDRVRAEASLDGVYVVRTSLPKERMDGEETVRSYKLLSKVERAIRSFKTIDLKARPIYHNGEGRVRSHIFLCLLACYVQWHMMEVWRPLIFADEDHEAKAVRDPVAPAKRSDSALAKVHTKRLPDGTLAHSFRTLLEALSTLVRNLCRRRGAPADELTFEMDTPPDEEQQRAYDLLKTIEV